MRCELYKGPSLEMVIACLLHEEAVTRLATNAKIRRSSIRATTNLLDLVLARDLDGTVRESSIHSKPEHESSLGP